jgi:hypothetical protein
MGNIISDQTGNLVSTSTDSAQRVELTSFSKIINDTLLELDLYSGSENRSEIDYSKTNFTKDRRKDASGNLVDINGLKYTTDEVVFENADAKLNMDESNTNANKYYNMKRAFCNASNKVPVNMIGVDLPDDSEDPITTHNQKMIDDKTFYTAKQAPLGVLNSKQLDNCIKYGDINGKGDQPGIYSFNTNSAHFYVNLTKYIDISGSGSSQALVLVNRSAPIYFSPIALDPANPSNVTSVGVVSGTYGSLISIEYFDNTLVGTLISNTRCIGIYTEINNEYESNVNPIPKNNSKVIGYPLLITSYGISFSKIRDNGNIVDQFLKFLQNEKYISYDINEILINDSSTVVIGTKSDSVSIVVPDANNNPILKTDYVMYTNTTPTIPLPSQLNYTIFFKQKTIIDPTSITISDLNTKTEMLNDYSNKSVYGAVLSDECKIKLDNLITNSYVTADVTKYSKLSDVYDPNHKDNNGSGGFVSGNISSFKLSQDPNTNTFTFRSTDTRADSSNNLSYGVTKAIGQTAGNSIQDVTESCKVFYPDLCDFYYKTDVMDGIQYNTTFNNARITNNDMSNYMKNLQFLGEHIPDCKCKNSTVVKLDKTNSVKSDDYFLINKCEYNSRMYGIVNGDNALYSQPGNAVVDNRNETAEEVSIYNLDVRNLNNFKDANDNSIQTNTNVKPFRRQIDPANAFKTSMSDSLFLFAGDTGDGRSKPVTINNYTCNLSYTSNISGVGGNVITSGVSLACNFPSGTPGAPEPASSKPSELSKFDGVFYNPLTKSNVPLDGSNNYVMNAFGLLTFQLRFPTPTFLIDFNTKYAFQFTNQNDNSSLDVLADNCSSVPAGQPCTGPINVKVPFLYGSKNNSNGVRYIIRLKNLTDVSLNIPNQLFSSITVKQYSMKITSVRIISQNREKAVSFTIDLNTSDMIPNIPYRVIFTSTTNRPNTTSPHVIEITNSDFFSTVANTSGPINIFDPKFPFQNLVYNYQFRINETMRTNVGNLGIGNKIYSGGYTLLYDDKMPSINKEQIDFTSVRVGFNSFVLQYKDYDNNNVLNMVAQNDTIKMGVTMMAVWDFYSDDTAYSYINIYYTTNLPNADREKINTAPISIKDPQFYFIFPIFPTSVIVTINACASDKNGNDIILNGVPQYSSININLKSADVIQTFRNWKIITDKLFPSSDISDNNQIKLTNLNTNTLSITEYLSYASAQKYTNIMFDYDKNKWYYTNNSLVQYDGSQTGTKNYTIFQTLPVGNLSIADITFLDDTGSNVSLFPSSSNITHPSSTVMMGSSLNISWVYTPASQYNIDIQVKIFGGVNGTFTIEAGKTSGVYPIILYDTTGNLNTQATDVQLVSYETNIMSNIKKIQNIKTDPGLSTNIDTNRNATVNVKIPIIFLNNPDPNQASVINKINLILSDSLDGIFFVYYQNVADKLSISSFNVKILSADYAKPLSFIHSVKTSDQFTNVKFGLRKKYIEHFEEHLNASNVNINKQIHIDTLVFDYSNTNPNYMGKLSIVSTFNNYYAVYINSLVINLGSNSLDNYKFDIGLIGTYLSNNTKFNVTSVTVIGKLTTHIFFVKELPGLETVIYKDKLGNNTKLVYSNGNYSIPEDFVSSPIVSSPSPSPPNNSGLPIWVIILIVVIILGLIGVGVYFMMKKKK